jgi:regulator of RNase E activity RraA
MIKRLHISKGEDVPADWQERTVVLWEEDDAPVPDKERTDAAFRRIAGRAGDPILTIDQGDQLVYFYWSGWVKAINCEGGWVGVLITGMVVDADELAALDEAVSAALESRARAGRLLGYLRETRDAGT